MKFMSTPVIRMMGKRIAGLFLLLIFFASCGPDGQQGPDIKKLDVKPLAVKIHRYEQALFRLNPNLLQQGLPA